MTHTDMTKQPATSSFLRVSKQTVEGFAASRIQRLSSLRQRLFQKVDSAPVQKKVMEKFRQFDARMQAKYGATYASARNITIGVSLNFTADKIGAAGLTAACAIGAFRSLYPTLSKAQKESEEKKSDGLFSYLKKHKPETLYCLGGAMLSGCAAITGIIGSEALFRSARGEKIPEKNPNESRAPSSTVKKIMDWKNGIRYQQSGSGTEAKASLVIKSASERKESSGRMPWSTALTPEQRRLVASSQIGLFSADMDLSPKMYMRHSNVSVRKSYIKGDRYEGMSMTKEVDGLQIEQIYNETTCRDGGKYITFSKTGEGASNTAKYVSPEGREINLDSYMKEAGKIANMKQDEAEIALYNILQKEHGTATAGNIIEARSRELKYRPGSTRAKPVVFVAAERRF